MQPWNKTVNAVPSPNLHGVGCRNDLSRPLRWRGLWQYTTEMLWFPPGGRSLQGSLIHAIKRGTFGSGADGKPNMEVWRSGIATQTNSTKLITYVLVHANLPAQATARPLSRKCGKCLPTRLLSPFISHYSGNISERVGSGS